ncbi:hypothetical protein Tco_1250113 [Tanacetum coccineum]
MLLLQPQILLGERTRVRNPSVPPDSEPSKCQNPTTARGACFECGGTDHYKPACPRLNQAQGPGVNLPNQALAIDRGMDWLYNHKAKIICHEKVVRIPLLDGKVLRVLGERPEEKARHLMSTKAKEQKQEEMVLVSDFPEVFPDDLSGLPHIQEIEFWIEFVPGAIPVVKSPYRLAPFKMEELSGQFKEL